MPTSDFLHTSQSRSNKKSYGRQNIPGSIVSVGDLDQFQASNCTSADQTNNLTFQTNNINQRVSNLYSHAQTSLDPLAEPALKIDSIIELEASEA
jgi:hypothetical protein